MSAVKTLLDSAVKMRMEESRRLMAQVEYSVEIIQSATKRIEENNSDIEEYLDALESENDHLERIEG